MKTEKDKNSQKECDHCGGTGQVQAFPDLVIVPEKMLTCPICEGRKTT